MKDQPVQYGPPFKRARMRKSRRSVKKTKHVNRGLTAKSLEALGQLHWYLVRVPTQKEFVLERVLDDAGVVAFAPIELKLRRSNRYQQRRREVRFPLMPGYLLVALPISVDRDRLFEDPAWSLVLQYRLVSGVVCSNGHPARVPFGQVRRLIENHTVPETRRAKGAEWMRTYAEFEPGDMVEVKTGSLAGLVVEVTEINGPSAKMVIKLFGGERVVELPVNDLGRVA